MKPSEIELDVPCPLFNTFGKSEYEITVALLVMACEHNGDQFGPLLPQQIAEALLSASERDPWQSWLRNPFLRPNISDLVDAGFAEFLGDPREACPVQLTAETLTRLRKWRR